jgi:hypothetical protein
MSKDKLLLSGAYAPWKLAAKTSHRYGHKEVCLPCEYSGEYANSRRATSQGFHQTGYFCRSCEVHVCPRHFAKHNTDYHSVGGDM